MGMVVIEVGHGSHCGAGCFGGCGRGPPAVGRDYGGQPTLIMTNSIVPIVEGIIILERLVRILMVSLGMCLPHQLKWNILMILQSKRQVTNIGRMDFQFSDIG